MSEAIEYSPTEGISVIDPDPKTGFDMEPLDARAQLREFEPSLTLAIFRTRSLRSFATPCHGRGASF